MRIFKDEVIESDDRRYESTPTSMAEDLSKLLVGRRIEAVAVDQLVLDDGTVLDVVPNDGCGGCASGYYHIDEIAKFDNAITSVTYVQREQEGEWGDPEDVYEVFVYAATGPSAKVLQVSGTVGNGYYGSGYKIVVKRPVDA
jgi:hypothetical protein